MMKKTLYLVGVAVWAGLIYLIAVQPVEPGLESSAEHGRQSANT